MDSPDEDAWGLPLPVVRFEAGRVALSRPEGQGEYQGELRPEGRFDGAWHQGGRDYPLDLTRREDLSTFTADGLVAQLDAAGVQRALVLSLAYWFGAPTRQVDDEYAKVRAENDWVAREVARYPDRLVGFCSFNPLKDYALTELDRCAGEPSLSGLKLHFGNSDVDLQNPEHVKKLRELFGAANERELPIVVHLWTLDWDRDSARGRQDAQVFLRDILSEALIAERFRQLGISPILFGTDGFETDVREAWGKLRRLLPLSDAEIADIANNVPSYMR